MGTAVDSQSNSIIEGLFGRGVSRRDFMKFCTVTAAG